MDEHLSRELDTMEHIRTPKVGTYQGGWGGDGWRDGWMPAVWRDGAMLPGSGEANRRKNGLLYVDDFWLRLKKKLAHL